MTEPVYTLRLSCGHRLVQHEPPHRDPQHGTLALAHCPECDANRQILVAHAVGIMKGTPQGPPEG